jgi:CRISPR/Cas system-associated endonuclease Cas3-HD
MKTTNKLLESGKVKREGGSKNRIETFEELRKRKLDCWESERKSTYPIIEKNKE